MSRIVDPSVDIFNATSPCFGLTLDECIFANSPWEYKPSLALNGLLVGIFGVAFAAHAIQGVWGKTWGFAVAMVLGCTGKFSVRYRPSCVALRTDLRVRISS